MRTVAGYLGHESVSMTLGTYADVDMASSPPIGCDIFGNGPASQPQDLAFTVGQPEAILPPGQDPAGRRGVRSQIVTLECGPPEVPIWHLKGS